MHDIIINASVKNGSDSFVDDYQRKSVIDNLQNFKPNNGNFYYFHIKMPHSPYTYFDEFHANPNDSELVMHLAYKNFLLKKDSMYLIIYLNMVQLTWR